MLKKLRRIAGVPQASPQAAPVTEFNTAGEVFRTLDRGHAEAYIAARTRFAYLGNNRGIAMVLGRYKMHLDTTDQGFAPHMIFDGYWEYWLSKFLAATIQPGDVVCDVGANLGYYSLLMAELVGPGGRVHAFEPNPAICSLMRASLAVNGFAARSNIHEIALANHEHKDVSFFVPRNEPKNGMMVPAGFKSSRGDTVSVRTARFDTLPFDRLDLLKIDVEGAEIEVLEGMRKMREIFQPRVVAEVNFGRGYTYDVVVDLLGKDGELQHIDYSGAPQPLTRDMASHQRVNEDWLVYYPGR